MSKRIIFHGAAVVLVASVAFAQETPKPAAPPAGKATDHASTGEASSAKAKGGRKSGAIVAADMNYRQSAGNVASPGLVPARGLQDSKADANAPQASRNSGHATESLQAQEKPASQSNPMYQDKGNAGANPLFESKDNAAVKPGSKQTGASGKSASVEYKDPEDQTTRYRPGNKKTN